VTNVGTFTNECATDNVATPYCAVDINGGAVCTANPTTECTETVAPVGQIFNCTGVGYFPGKPVLCEMLILLVYEFPFTRCNKLQTVPHM
jgi:hypothetical protein